MYTEKARVINDLALWVMAGLMLFWAVYLWSVGRITPGDVVLVSALTFRILHGSRDLALSLVGRRAAVRLHRGHAAVIAQSQSVCDAPRRAGRSRPRGGRSPSTG
jgi:ATP-binding cassette subfamily B protein